MAEKTKYSTWQQRKAEVEAAKGWDKLPEGPRYKSDSFAISPVHCVLKLMRCGQQSHGAKNYWVSPDALNTALISVIVKRSRELIAEAIEVMENKERAALLECKAWVESMQSEITEIERVITASQPD